MWVAKYVPAPNMNDQPSILTPTDERESMIPIKGDSEGIQRDGLALTAYYTKSVLNCLLDFCKRIEDSKFYKIITATTQPAHIVTIIAVVAVGCLMYRSPSENAERQSPLLNLIYLGCVSAHFGAQLWMSFVSGLSLYFALPRRTFGKVQRCLFPKYFFMNAILSLVSLSLFLNNNNTKLDMPQIFMQTVILTLCFMVELLVRLYLTPPLLRLMEKTSEYEEAAGVGMEIGKHDPGSLAMNENYVKNYKAFRKMHTTIAIGNIITMGCSVMHLHYLSNKLYVL